MRTASFEASAKQTQAQVSAMRAGFDSLSGTVDRARSLLGTFGIALGAAALGRFVGGVVQAAGDLGELAQQLGVTTDTLQSLQFAAAQNNVSTEQLEAGLSKLTRTIGEAADGNKKAVDTFNALKIGVLDAQGHIRSTDQILFDLAARLQGIKDPAARAAIEVDTLGKAGQRLDPILSGGREGLARYIEEARRAGAVLSGETIKTLDDTGDKFEVLKIQVKDFVATWTGEFIKALQGSPSELDQFTSSLQGVADKLNDINAAAQASGKAVHDFFANLGASDDKTKAAMERLRLLDQPRTDEEKGLLPRGPDVTLGSNAGALQNLFGDSKDTSNPRAKSDLDSAAKKIQEVVAALKLQRDNLARTAEQQEVYNQLARAGTTINTAAGQAIAQLVTEIEAGTAAKDADTQLENQRIDALTRSDQALAASFTIQKQMQDAAQQRQADIQQEIKDNEALIEALGGGAHAYAVEQKFIELRNAAMQAGQPLIGAEIENARQQAETLTTQAETLQRIQQSAADVQAGMEAVSGEFIDAAVGVKTWGDAAKASLGEVLKLIAKLIEQQLILSFGGSSGGGSSGGGILGTILGIGGSLLGGLFGGGGGGAFPGVPTGGRLATGGDVSAGGLYRVGEHGEEWFAPGMDGAVIPHSFSTGSGGGIAIHNSYDFRGSSVDQADVRRAVEEGNRKTYSAVFAAMNRGGPEARASGRRTKK
jgi:hypothetical protein